ncbi:hypothetical protein DPMN_002814 [Dreissena polymorpha]|uniref:Uncharacterized protein n=1 Tax=Dreissena polymorpha TaxID=45954 RepID=A0A9D4MKS2_DREPO|nr:hypothetical protein DPMN_002814 [Dreissena polymorpha]
MVNTGVVRCYSDGDASGGSSAQGGGLHRQAGHLAAPEHRGHRPTGEQLRTLGYIGERMRTKMYYKPYEPRSGKTGINACA